jgi:hypothetical protein
MIPDDSPRTPIRIELPYKGNLCLDEETGLANIQGYAYAYDDSPDLHIVTVLTVKGEVEVHDPHLGHSLNPMDDAIAQALWDEARSSISMSNLEEAFNEFKEGKKKAAQERAHRLRSEAAE